VSLKPCSREDPGERHPQSNSDGPQSHGGLDKFPSLVVRVSRQVTASMVQAGDGMNSGSRHLDYLDGIRAFAAFWVMIAHCMEWGGSHGIPIPNPRIAVNIFIVMSGFLMNYHYLLRPPEAASQNVPEALKFYIRRFFRIAPCYYLSLVLAFFIVGNMHLQGYSVLRQSNPAKFAHDVIYDPSYIQYTFSNLMAHVSFVFGLIPSYSFSTMLPDWSISLEMQFYLAFPLIFFLLRRVKYFYVIWTIIAVSFVLNAIFARMPGIRPGAHGLFPEPSFFFANATLFLVGMMACDAACNKSLSGVTRLITSVTCVLAAALSTWYDKGNILIVALAAYLLIVNSRPSQPSRFAAFTRLILGNRITRFGADLSYSVYLFHGFFISHIGYYLFTRQELALTPILRFAYFLAGVVVSTCLFSTITHYTVERPCIRLGKRIVNTFETKLRSFYAGQPS
jgi:peptidoglycan/LPS O-acetylase OafA/YrhL